MQIDRAALVFRRRRYAVCVARGGERVGPLLDRSHRALARHRLDVEAPTRSPIRAIRGIRNDLGNVVGHRKILACDRLERATGRDRLSG